MPNVEEESTRNSPVGTTFCVSNGKENSSDKVENLDVKRCSWEDKCDKEGHDQAEGDLLQIVSLDPLSIRHLEPISIGETLSEVSIA